jgi:hypothetical protein
MKAFKQIIGSGYKKWRISVSIGTARAPIKGEEMAYTALDHPVTIW